MSWCWRFPPPPAAAAHLPVYPTGSAWSARLAQLVVREERVSGKWGSGLQRQQPAGGPVVLFVVSSHDVVPVVDSLINKGKTTGGLAGDVVIRQRAVGALTSRLE